MPTPVRKKYKPLTVTIDDKTRERLKEIMEQTEDSASEVVRKAIKAYGKLVIAALDRTKEGMR